MAARVDVELGRELGVSAVVVQTAAAEHLSEPDHVFWTDAPGGQRRKEYTAAGRALLRSLLGGMRVEKGGGLSLPGAGFTLWLPKERADEKRAPIPHPVEEKRASGPQGGEPVLLTILRLMPNPIWVVVRTPDNRTATVRVRHSRLLVPGKKLACAPLEGGAWECADRLVSPNPAWR